MNNNFKRENKWIKTLLDYRQETIPPRTKVRGFLVSFLMKKFKYQKLVNNETKIKTDNLIRAHVMGRDNNYTAI